MLEQCNEYLIKNSEILRNDCEIAMDVFDVLSHPKIIEEKFFGFSATSSCISVLAIAISSMALKVCTCIHNFDIFSGIFGYKSEDLYPKNGGGGGNSKILSFLGLSF